MADLRSVILRERLAGGAIPGRFKPQHLLQAVEDWARRSCAFLRPNMKIRKHRPGIMLSQGTAIYACHKTARQLGFRRMALDLIGNTVAFQNYRLKRTLPERKGMRRAFLRSLGIERSQRLSSMAMLRALFNLPTSCDV